ncbi:hypothetical protein RUND412_000113 [Rhizina undulata]
MRYGTFVNALVALWLCTGLVTSIAIISPRQNGGSSTAISVSSPTTDGNVASTSGLARSQATGSGATPTSTSSKKASQSSGTSADTPAPTMSGGLASSNSTSTQIFYQGGLPISPKVTPGIAVAGVLLMLAGIPFCLIGIKIKMLQIFLSTAFLCGLSVTVLIIYVMNPPVPNAIQGAYVTAVTVTGLLSGGLAIVFPEVTEALGCLLGGFCVSMWFLVLKPGGLVTSVYGKLVLIASFCLVIFSLAFHRLTRPYALIFSISFSGATSIVLGLDCFSRAGLKEFWLYIWALNDNLFPLGTYTYPHTRGIRVEICVIILITAFGIMSQVKLWKILKARRAIKDTEKRQQEADLEALDEDAGRRVEEEQKVERAQWEAKYGAKNKEIEVDEQPVGGCDSGADSGIGDGSTTGKKSGESSGDFLETDEMKREREEHSQNAQAEGSGTAANLSEDDKEMQVPETGIEITTIPVGTDEYRSVTPKEDGFLAPETAANRLSTQTGQTVYHDTASRPASRRDSTQSIPIPEKNVKRFNVPPPPKVVPLPIPIPTETEDDDEVSSLATFAESIRLPIPLEEPTEMRPTIKIVNEPEEEEEEEEDKASSLVVTCDDGFDTEYQDLGAFEDKDTEKRLSTTASSNVVHEPGETLLAEEAVAIRHTPDASSPRNEPNENTSKEIHNLESEKKESLVVESTPSDGNKNNFRKGSTEMMADKPSVIADHSKDDTGATAAGGRTASPSAASLVEPKSPPMPQRLPDNLAPASSPDPDASAASSVVDSHSSQLLVKCSKVVRNYRTNEWAKHLSEADAPELEKIEDNVYTNNSGEEEKPVPVHFNELQETAEIPSQPSSRPVSKLALYEPYPSITPPPGGGPLQVTKSRHAPRNSASPTSPKQRAISPVERAVSPSGRTTLLPFGQNTLIGKRESIVRSRPSFNTLTEFPPAASPVSPADLSHRTSYNALSRHSPVNGQSPLNPSPVLDDDMPLSARRTELRQHSASQRVNPQNPQAHRRSLSQQPENKREALMKSWRESIKTDQHTNVHATHQISERRGEMIIERQQALRKHLKDSLQDEVMEERMRQRNIHQLHTEAMRKMQASANKHVNANANSGAEK